MQAESGDKARALKGQLASRPVVRGERFTMADVYAGSQVGLGLVLGSIAPGPEFAAYAERFPTRSTCMAAQDIDKDLIEDMRK